MFIYVACASTRPSYHLHALCSSEPIYSHDMHSLDSLVCMLSLHRAQHYCDGCCDASDPNSSGDNLFSSGCEIDLCCAKQGNVSVDDWGTGGVACGRVSGGIMVHRALPKSFTDALPTWSSMMPAEAQNSRGEACEKMRIKIQRKSWRTNVFFSSWDKEKQVLTLCWTAWPVERRDFFGCHQKRWDNVGCHETRREKIGCHQKRWEICGCHQKRWDNFGCRETRREKKRLS